MVLKKGEREPLNVTKYSTGLDGNLDDLENYVIAAATKWVSLVCLDRGLGWSRKDNTGEISRQLKIFRLLWIFLSLCFLKACFSWINKYIIFKKIYKCLVTSQICSCFYNFR